MHLQIRFAVAGQRPGDKPAQGNALGGRQKMRQALKERHKPGLCRPFRAGVFLWAKPRALPWAGLFAHPWCSRRSPREMHDWLKMS